LSFIFIKPDVIDKKVGFFMLYFSSGQKGWSYFGKVLHFIFLIIILLLSNETERSSVGEQLFRDKLDA
jgi:hypothetical protein